MNTRDLLEKRAALVQEMRSITTSASGGGGDLSQEQSEKFNGLKEKLEAVEKQIDRQRFVDEAERRMQGEPINGNGDHHLDDALSEFSLRRAIAGAAGLNVDWGRERELSAEIAKRAGRPFQGVAVPMHVFRHYNRGERRRWKRFEERVLTTLLPAGGPGGNLISTDFRGDEYIDRLRAALRVRQLGARVLSGLVGNVVIPRLKSSATAGWVAENSGLTPSDQEIEQVSLTPKHCGALTEFSRNMLMQSSPDIEQLISSDFAALLAEAVDSAAIMGNGSADEPDGILATSGIGDVSLGAAGGEPTWGAILDIISKVELANAVGAGWLTNPKVVKKLRSTVKVANTDSAMIMEAPDSLAGYPLVSSNLVPSNLVEGASGAVLSALIFGNFSDLLLGYWSELDILTNPYSEVAYTKGNVLVRGMVTMDVKLRHPASFSATKEMITT